MYQWNSFEKFSLTACISGIKGDSWSLVQTKLSPDFSNSNGEPSSPKFKPPLQPHQPRICICLDLFAGHSAPVAARGASLDHFIPFDIEYDPTFYILDDKQFENLLQLVHSGVVGAIWSAPPGRLFTSKRWWTTSFEISPSPWWTTGHYSSTTSTSARISRNPSQIFHSLHLRLSTRRFSRFRATHQLSCLAGTFSSNFSLPMLLLKCCYPCLQMGIRLVQDLGLCSNLRQNRNSRRSLPPRGSLQLWRQKTHLYQLTISRISLHACSRYPWYDQTLGYHQSLTKASPIGDRSSPEHLSRASHYWRCWKLQLSQLDSATSDWHLQRKTMDIENPPT